MSPKGGLHEIIHKYLDLKEINWIQHIGYTQSSGKGKGTPFQMASSTNSLVDGKQVQDLIFLCPGYDCYPEGSAGSRCS